MAERLALVVEDDRGLRAIYQKVLGDMGYQVIEAQNGVSALELLESHAPDILFLDILLPQLNGSEILEYIQSAEHLQNLRTVVVTSNRQFEVDALEFPNTEFLLKPIRPAQIRELANWR
jgi:CheY-like chemotaxis protein